MPRQKRFGSGRSNDGLARGRVIIIFQAIEEEAMRYLFGLICAIACAGVTAKFVATWLAPMITKLFTYESPDGEAFVEQATFILALGLALWIGWIIGWALGRSLERPDKPI